MSDRGAIALFKMNEDVVGKARHGGKRLCAGRKKTGRRVGGPHRVRPELSPRHPVHVTMRVRRHFPELRGRDWWALIRKTLTRYLGREDFCIVHGSIQNNHFHFLIEASGKRTLTRGVQSLAINLARALNGGIGKIFPYRYHAVQITTPRQARNTLAYVLNNWRRHREDFAGGRQLRAPVDPYSSGVTFTGWTIPPRFTVPAGYAPLPTSPPRTALLRSDWKRFGLIDPFERPGPIGG